MEMTSRERVMAALKLETPDRVPFCELAVDRALAEKLLGWDSGGAPSSGSLVSNPYTVEESIELAEYLGLDILSFIQRAPVYAKLQKGADSRSFPGEGLIKSEEDLAMIELPDPHKDEFYAEAEAFLAKRGDYAVPFVTRIGMFQAILGLGMENFSYALYDNPGLVEKLLDIYFDWTAVVAGRISQMGFDFFWTTDDFAFKNGLLFSPGVFKELMVPRYKRVLDRLSIPWVLHSDGDISEALDILIDLGVSAVHPVEKGAMDIREVKQRYGDRICLIGNVDLNILGLGTPEDTEHEVLGLLRDVAPGGGYMISSGNSLASYLDPECVKAMSRTISKYGSYPIDVP